MVLSKCLLGRTSVKYQLHTLVPADLPVIYYFMSAKIVQGLEMLWNDNISLYSLHLDLIYVPILGITLCHDAA